MAYAAVVSLKHSLKYLEDFLISRSENEYLSFSYYAYKHLENFGISRSEKGSLESLISTLRRLDGSSNRRIIDRNAINALDEEIREVVHKFEDVILSHFLSAEEEGLEEEIISFSETVRKLKEEYSRELDNPLTLQEEDDDVLQADEFDGKNSTTVGYAISSSKSETSFLNSQSETKVVSLTGMAGIGKSHLAREIYHEPLIDERFDFKLWLSVGPRQPLKHVWVEIVALVEGVPRNSHMKTNFITLIGLLRKSLRGRGRCLIVLDDIWSVTVCDCLVRLLRIDGNGRRILLTTRLEEVAEYFSTSIHQIRFMDNEESWKLLWQNVFGEDYFPRQLEKAGKKIAENCDGLPLLILAVAEILCGFEKTEEYWNEVEDSKTNTFPDAYEKISEVLFSSYEYLPQYLKACFLYMGVFPQKYQIPLPKLLHLWIVDDVLEPQSFLSMTRKIDTAVQSTSRRDKALMRQPLDKVVSRNLGQQSRFGIARGSKKKPPFMHMQSKPGVLMISENVDLSETSRVRILEDDTSSRAERRLCRDARTLDNVNWNYKTNHFKICRYEAKKPLESLYLLEPGPSPIQFIEPWQKTKSRDPRLCLNRDLWSPTRKQPLPKAGDISAPKVKTTRKGIAMEYLKKLVSHSLPIVCKRSSTNKIKSCKLHSAYWYLCVKEARKNMFFHVLKKLSNASTDYIELLESLHSLKCVIVNPQQSCKVVAPPDHLSNLPHSLKKLSLNGMGYSWEHMGKIGSLPRLKVLKLRYSAFQGPVWITMAGEFKSLEFLLLEDIDLVQWTIDDDDDDCFSSLQCLIIQHCYKLKEIPSQIGCIPTLKRIEVVDCSPSMVASALQIQGKRSSVQVVISSSWNRR